MTDELKPVSCGCGGEARIVYIDGEDSEDTFVECTRCKISVPVCPSEEEAVTAWNKAMGERTEKAEWSEPDGCYLCGGCGRQVEEIDSYCAECGVRLDWSE